MNNLKVFEIRFNYIIERAWIAAKTNIEALQIYCNEFEIDIIEFDAKDDIIEIEESEWCDYAVLTDNGIPKMTIAQWMKENYKPEFLGTTIS